MYNCYNSCHNSCCCGGDEITSILKKVVKMQKEAVKEEYADQFCDANDLGHCGYRNTAFNTRPLQIFTLNDQPWHCPIDGNEDGCGDPEHGQTCVFRVEKVEDGVATFRALIDYRSNPDYNPCEQNGYLPFPYERYKSTSSYITIKLCNIAAVRCLKDCFVDICIR